VVDEYPLTLLTKLETSDLASIFLDFLKESEDAFLFRRHSNNQIDISYCGIRFSCKFTATPSGVVDAKQVMLNSDLSASVSGLSIGFGELVKSELPIFPIVRTLLELASHLSKSLPTLGVMWSPAQIVCGPDFFNSSIDDFTAGGAFPSLPLIRFESDNRGKIYTRGVDWFARQEVEIEAADFGQDGGIRRLVRVIHDIVENGAITEDVEVAGFEPDEKLFFSVNAEENLVEIRTYCRKFCPRDMSIL